MLEKFEDFEVLVELSVVVVCIMVMFVDEFLLLIDGVMNYVIYMFDL